MDTNISIKNLEKRLEESKDQTEADKIENLLLLAKLEDAIKRIPRNM